LPAVLGADDVGGAIAGGGVGVHGMRVLLDDLAGFRIDQPAVTVLNGNGDLIPTRRALTFLRGHRLGGFEPAGAVAAVEAVAFAAEFTGLN